LSINIYAVQAVNIQFEWLLTASKKTAELVSAGGLTMMRLSGFAHVFAVDGNTLCAILTDLSL
jgi:hypothetical protein